jgi:hypothetical protein
MKKYIDIRVSAFEPELKEFLRLCAKIQYLGVVGASRNINVSVDGDGSGRVKFAMVHPDGKVEEFHLPEFKDSSEREKYIEDLKLSIGE